MKPDIGSAIDPARRRILQGAATMAAAAPFMATRVTGATMAHGDDELCRLSACDAIAAMAGGDVTAERYAGALLARCEAGRSLNAFVALHPAQVLGAAREADRRRAKGMRLGPLHGLPVPVKDSVNTQDYPTTGGTPALRDFRPRTDATVVASLRRAGALVLGKTSLHELSFGWTSNNHAFGAVRNPYDPARIPGGSSGGTAAAVAARMAPLGVAEDTQGSIRVPAALCGIVGFRPTTGRYSTEGAVPISALFDQVGPHARCVRDIALFDRAITNDARPLADVSLKGVRIALDRAYFFAGLDPQVARITEHAIARLREAGAVFVEQPIPGLASLIDAITYQVQNHDLPPQLAEYLKAYGAGVTFDDVVRSASDDIRAAFAKDVLPGAPGFVTEGVYGAVIAEHLPRLKATLRDYYARTGAAALLFPATCVAAPRIGDETDFDVAGRSVAFDVAIARNISPGSTAALPGLVLPAGLTAEGLPVAIELDARSGDDRALLALGASVEAVLGPLAAPTL